VITSIPSLELYGLRVLFAEDEVLLADEVLDELGAAGATVVGPITTVTAAVAQIAGTARFDAALINVKLRGEETRPVADALIKCGTPFAFVAGDDAFVREFYPAIPVHAKPIDMAAVMGFLAGLTPKALDAASLPVSTKRGVNVVGDVIDIVRLGEETPVVRDVAIS